ncbi:hypothetical protein [Paenibacillus oryzisoli]|nr:hypothetical protein [Paenibacillus oryzisoli]
MNNNQLKQPSINKFSEAYNKYIVPAYINQISKKSAPVANKQGA